RRGTLRLELPEGTAPEQMAVEPTLLEEAAERLLEQVDAVHGGFGSAPKFPHPMGLEFLLRIEYRRGASRGEEATADSDRLMRLVGLTLDKVVAGGIYDQIGGGCHRYSTDTPSRGARVRALHH